MRSATADGTESPSSILQRFGLAQLFATLSAANATIEEESEGMTIADGTDIQNGGGHKVKGHFRHF
jgi:hypothetical protein